MIILRTFWVLIAKKNPILSERSLHLDDDNEVLQIGSNVNPEDANYEFVGMALFNKKVIEHIKSIYFNDKEKYLGEIFTHLYRKDIVDAIADANHLEKMIKQASRKPNRSSYKKEIKGNQ